MVEYALFLQGSGGSMCGEFVMLEIMTKYGWTYDEYMNTPLWIIRYVIAKMNIENQDSNDKLKK